MAIWLVGLIGFLVGWIANWFSEGVRRGIGRKREYALELSEPERDPVGRYPQWSAILNIKFPSKTWLFPPSLFPIRKERLQASILFYSDDGNLDIELKGKWLNSEIGSLSIRIGDPGDVESLLLFNEVSGGLCPLDEMEPTLPEEFSIRVRVIRLQDKKVRVKKAWHVSGFPPNVQIQKVAFDNEVNETNNNAR